MGHDASGRNSRLLQVLTDAAIPFLGTEKKMTAQMDKAKFLLYLNTENTS